MIIKRFLKRLLIFIIPILSCAIGIEAFIFYYPNAFNTKAFYLKANMDIELLILGSSHNQNDINPEYLNLKTANLSYGNQDISLDNELFFRYVNDLKQLKCVLLEIDYHTLEAKRDKNYFRFPWYYKYHGIGEARINLTQKMSLYRSSPEFFNNYIIRRISPFEPKIVLNKFGFVTSGNIGSFEELNYDETKIYSYSNKRVKKLLMGINNRPKKVSLKIFKGNIELINNIIQYCHEHDIKVLLISNPLYKTYRQNKVEDKDSRRKLYIDSVLAANIGVVYQNYEEDSRFLITDFKDSDHLNPKGAEKFSKIIDSVLTGLLK